MRNLTYLFIFFIGFSSCKSLKYNDLKDGLYADLQTNKGDILLKLYAKEVPMTVANFVALAEGTHPKVSASLKGKRYYDGITFHRVMPNFMIQSGDPTGTGRGNAGYKFPDEFPSDSLGNLIYRHDRKGVVSMANSGPKTNSSQFFITHEATPWLDGNHTVFGHVVEGMDVVNDIRGGDGIESVEIVRVGAEAEGFDAVVVFEELK